MKFQRIATICVTSVAALIAACSTPAPVRDLASRSSATVGLAEGALRQYIATTNAQLDARMQLLRTDAEQLEREKLRRELDHFLNQAASISDAEMDSARIVSLAAKRKEIREKQEVELAQVTAEYSLDTAALAKVPAEKLAAAKKEFAVLSEELSASEWITLIGGYAKIISEGVGQLTSPADKKGK
jgi:hypothetical protein